jgi:L-lactate dehydrogenase complex protein LldF
MGRVAESPLVGKDGWIGWLPGLLGGWTQVRDLQEMPKVTFRDWWEKRGGNGN